MNAYYLINKYYNNIIEVSRSSALSFFIPLCSISRSQGLYIEMRLINLRNEEIRDAGSKRVWKC